jgi:hypothetical protein
MILNRLVVLSDRRTRADLDREQGLPASAEDPGLDSVDAALRLAGLTLSKANDELGRQLGIRDLLDEFRLSLRLDDNPAVILLDGLDEAAEPARIVSGLVRPLSEVALVVLTTRPTSDTADLKPSAGWDLANDPDAAQDITRFVAEGLSGIDRIRAWEIGNLAADVAGPGGFATARMIIALLESRTPSPDDPQWRSKLLGRLSREPRVFISHGRDLQGPARALQRALRQRGLTTFFDTPWEPGAQWGAGLTTSLVESFGSVGVLVLLIGSGPSGHWLDEEIDTALQQGVRVIPVVVGDPPLPYRNIPQRLAHIKAGELRLDRLDQDAGKLATELWRVLTSDDPS